VAVERGGIPSVILKGIIEEWVRQYGPTYRLYGPSTNRQDISGSVRPLVPGTDIKHEKVLAERADVSLKTIQRILRGQTMFVTEEIADKLIQAMDRADVWYVELREYV